MEKYRVALSEEEREGPDANGIGGEGGGPQIDPRPHFAAGGCGQRTGPLRRRHPSLPLALARALSPRVRQQFVTEGAGGRRESQKPQPPPGRTRSRSRGDIEQQLVAPGLRRPTRGSLPLDLGIARRRNWWCWATSRRLARRRSARR